MWNILIIIGLIFLLIKGVVWLINRMSRQKKLAQVRGRCLAALSRLGKLSDTYDVESFVREHTLEMALVDGYIHDRNKQESFEKMADKLEGVLSNPATELQRRE